MSMHICNNPYHIHSQIVPPTSACMSQYLSSLNFIAYSPRPIEINFEKFKFEKKAVTKITEENENDK